MREKWINLQWQLWVLSWSLILTGLELIEKQLPHGQTIDKIWQETWFQMTSSWQDFLTWLWLKVKGCPVSPGFAEHDFLCSSLVNTPFGKFPFINTPSIRWLCFGITNNNQWLLYRPFKQIQVTCSINTKAVEGWLGSSPTTPRCRQHWGYRLWLQSGAGRDMCWKIRQGGVKTG